MRGISDRGLDASTDEFPDFENLRKLSIAAGICSAVLFVVTGLVFRLQFFGDSALFSYAVAVQDSWAFHWHNISSRSAVYLYAQVPPEIYGRITGDAWAAIQIYGLLFFGAQLAGLALTYLLDRTPRGILFAFACLSNAVLCPLIFGAPSEMWVAHAFFWPALAAVHCSARPWSGLAAFAALLPLAFTHEGALVFIAAVLLSVLFRRGELSRFMQCLGAAAAVLGIWIFVRYGLRPDDYTARVLSAAALNVFNPEILLDRMLVLHATAAGALLVLSLAMRGMGVPYAASAALVAVLAGFAGYWLLGAHEIHTEHRYYLRTVVIVVCPLLAAAAICAAFETELVRAAGIIWAGPRAVAARIGAGALAALLLLVISIHVVETIRFAVAWQEYLGAFRRIVMDPAPKNRKYAEVNPLNPEFRGMPWFSTLPYLSILVAPGFQPQRLAVDPRSDYFWISCANSTASVQKANGYGVPVQSRQMIRDYNCQNRP